MGKARLLAEFESKFERMSLGELHWWYGYWLSYAQQLSPKARRWVMSRVYDVERAIHEKGGEVQEGAATAPFEESTPASSLGASPTQKAKALAGRIMYMERKAGGLVGASRIGRVTFSKTGRTLYYRGQKFQSLKGAGFKSNYFDVNTREDYWISGPKRGGGDRMYAQRTPVQIDEDVREEYWRQIRREPSRVHETVA